MRPRQRGRPRRVREAVKGMSLFRTESDAIDLAGYVVEHLALEIDPFPRKPGVEFVLPAQPPESSPFDVLRALKGGKSEE